MFSPFSKAFVVIYNLQNKFGIYLTPVNVTSLEDPSFLHDIQFELSNFRCHQWFFISDCNFVLNRFYFEHTCFIVGHMVWGTGVSNPNLGNGKPLMTTRIGKLKLDIMQKDGSSREVTLTGGKCVPNLFCKLFSITKALEKGLNIGNWERR